MQELYTNALGPSVLFTVLATGMTEDELKDAIHKSAYMLAVIEKRTKDYQHKWPYYISKDIPDEENSITTEETITLTPSYKISLTTLDIKSQKLSLQFGTHDIILWRENQPMKLRVTSLRKLKRIMERELMIR